MTTSRATARDPFPLAELHLRSAGFRVLDRCGDSALDPRVLIAADGEVLVACLIKTRQPRSRSTAAGKISRTKLRALRRIAVAWMDARSVRYEQVRVDVVAVTTGGPGGYAVEHVRGAAER